MRNEIDYLLFKLVNFVMALLVVCGTYGLALQRNDEMAALRPRRKEQRFTSSISRTARPFRQR
jgi:hypothetical protein